MTELEPVARPASRGLWPVALALAIAGGIGATLARADDAAESIVIVSSDQPAFAEAARAALATVGAPGRSVRADDSAKAAIENAEVVVAVGPLAERVVGRALSERAHAVACLTPRSTNLPAARATSVPLGSSSADVLSLLRMVLPSVRRVGVFAAGADATEQKVRDAEISEVARREGITPLFPEAGEPFAAAVDRLIASADVIWVDDASVLPTGGIALIVKRASDNNKAVVGPNRASVLSGALFAVVPDPAAHGRAAGELALHVLHGDDANPVQAPAGRVVLNGALSRTLNVRLPPAVARRTETIE